MNRKPQKDVFVMENYKTQEKYLCSFSDTITEYYGQKVCYIGVTNGLGGYNYMISKGFIDRKYKYIAQSDSTSLYKQIRQYLSKKEYKAWQLNYDNPRNILFGCITKEQYDYFEFEKQKELKLIERCRAFGILIV